MHIVFGDSIAGSLKLAMKQMGVADTKRIIAFRDHFSIGPLWQLHKEAGRMKRDEWFRDNINDSYGGVYNDDDTEVYHQRLMGMIEQIAPQASIVIWNGSNAHEQVGLRYAVYLLRHSKNRIYLFNAGDACSKRFNQADSSIDYLHTGEISEKKLQVIFGEAEEQGPITSKTRQLLEYEWLALAEHREVLRIWNGEGILSVDEHYFDSYLLETVGKLHHHRENHDFIKAARVIGEAIGHGDQYIGDSYFGYRLRHLIYNGELEIKGVPRAMRYYSVRRK
ncbi:MAG TPA: DUF1835 domain-containing protein [Paenibacillus sp.]